MSTLFALVAVQAQNTEPSNDARLDARSRAVYRSNLALLARRHAILLSRLMSEEDRVATEAANLLADAKVRVPKEASDLAGKKLFADHGFESNSNRYVIGLFTIGGKIDEFCERGDRIWRVAFTRHAEVVAELWVNASTGKTRWSFDLLDEL